MYEKISPETGEYFNFMVNNELLDLDTKPNKASGGYCTFIPGYKSPFIFSNFNGTSGDVDVLTHEAGHAFMAYRCRDYKLLETIWPTMEACEIHSMSMEFMAYPYEEAFFKGAADKYRFSHLVDEITFIPYGVAVDEFQEFVYENPNVTPAERNAKWREIEQKYLPHLKYGKNEYLNNGGRWQRQTHIYITPFYYIDYTIAQILAFEFFNLDRENHEDAWKRYLALCDLGGSKSFLNLLKDKNVRLVSPFKKGCIKKVVKPLKEYLAQFDDTKM
jgi:M3 family oligoendopeptidase